MSNIRSERININGLDIHYLTGGQGEPLVIVHGGSDGASAWKNNISVLLQKYTIYVPDMPGFGSSQSIEGAYYIPQMVDFIDNFTRSVGLDNFYLMGHSLGGGIAVNYTLKHPQKIRKLVLVSSLCMGSEIAWWIRLFSNRFVCRTIGKAAVSIFKAVKYIAKYFGPWELVEPITKTSIQIGSCIATLTQQTMILINQLPQIMVPTLVMWGAKDPVVPFKQAYAAAVLIPDCQVRVFEDAGHSVYREKLREFSRTLSSFLG